MSAPPVTSVAETSEQAERASAIVTPRRPLTAAERKAAQRERERLAKNPTYFERPDWSLFLDVGTLPQKAGCRPGDLRRLVLRELVDNALDAGARVKEPEEVGDCWVICDTGPGLDPDMVPRLFSVNRALVSSKQRLLPTRGMLGNGLRVVMGAVAAFNGWIMVETQGHRLELAVDRDTGLTTVFSDEPIPLVRGLTVRINLGNAGYGYGDLARETARLAGFGRGFYDGPTSPHWYSPADLRRLMQQAPEGTTVANVASWFAIDRRQDTRLAKCLDLDATTELLAVMRRRTQPVWGMNMGKIGPEAFKGYSHDRASGQTRGAVEIPYSVEAWAVCGRAERGSGRAEVKLILNRTVSAARIHAYFSEGQKLIVEGCDIYRAIEAKTGNYKIVLSVIATKIQLMTDGKEPSLSPFGDGIRAAIRNACARAHNAMGKPPGSMTIVDAAEIYMPDGYAIASANGTLPANARQIYYAMRRFLLEITPRPLKSNYFTQTILPDYLDAHPNEAGVWDVVYDDRGHFTEPHTGRSIGLGTIAVREYLGERTAAKAPATIDPGSMADTAGPENRYEDVLFLEKEGFNSLVSHAQICERFDLGLASSKGMSNTALRMLLDGLIKRGMKRVFVLHDFDASGFSIFGTLGTDSRRYKFKNKVEVIDLGLRLSDAREMELQDEEYSPKHWDSRLETLKRHGATYEEIHFLAAKRVELNAMPSDVFIGFLERKLTEHGVKKIVPEIPVMEQHARQILERAMTNKALEKIREKACADAAKISLPDDLHERVIALLKQHPAMPWDIAVARIAKEVLS
jgi:hypothetical protein